MFSKLCRNVVVLMLGFLVLTPRAKAGPVEKPIYKCEFEANEGFQVGKIGGQHKWGMSTKHPKFEKVVYAGAKTQWSGASGKQWLLIRPNGGYGKTPDLATDEYAVLKIQVDMRPAGNPRATKGIAGAIRFYSRSNKLYFVLILRRKALNSGIIQVLSRKKMIDTPISWKYTGADSTLKLNVTLDRTKGTWKIVAGDQVATGKINNRNLLKYICLVGGSANSWNDMSCFDNLRIFGVKGSVKAQALGADAMNREIQVSHAKLGHKIDKYYYDTGTEIDKMIFDLKELKRQGKQGFDNLLGELYRVNSKLRKDWLTLEHKREKIHNAINYLRPAGNNLLEIQSLDHNPGNFGWLGVRSAKLVFANGKEYKFALKDFKHGAFITNYKYQVPPANAVFVRNTYSRNNRMMAGFNLPFTPTGNAKLVIAAVDCDKPGRTVIKITLNGKQIFKGANPFKKTSWVTHEFPVGNSVFTNKKAVAASGNPALQELAALNKSAEAFYHKAKALVAEYEHKTKKLRAGLVYRKLLIDKKSWLNGYIRSFDIAYYPGSERYQSRFTYPGNYMDLDYIAKLSHDMGMLNIWLLGKKYEKGVLNKLQQYQLPYLAWASNDDFVDGDIISYHYFKHEDEAINTLVKLDKQIYKPSQELHGFYIDECVLYDKHKKLGSIVNDKFFINQFYFYLTNRRPYLTAHNIKIPASASVITLPPTKNDPLWMEWQIFKKEFSAEHFKRMYDHAADKNIFILTLLMNKNMAEPQSGSWVSFGKRFPVLMTDLYNNGMVTEGMYMQLFENSVNGKAIMTPGAGYSCRTPDRFKRSLSIAMAHASGIWLWTYKFFAKYRDANYFWRYAGQKPNVDDRGRSLLDAWRPEYWDITKTSYEQMRTADKLLADGKSQAKIVYLISERSAIAKTKINRATSINSHNLGIYSYLIQSGKPFDVCFIESLSKKKLQQYKLAMLFRDDVMTDAEVSMLKEWVKRGGTLIASGKSSLYDEWGRKNKNYSLSDVYGVDFNRIDKKTALSFRAFNLNTGYSKVFKDVANIKLHKNAQAVGRFADGTPALIMNSYGAGKSFLMTADVPGWIDKKQPLNQAALWGICDSGFDKLLLYIINQTIKPKDNLVSMDKSHSKNIAVSIKKYKKTYIVHLIDYQDFRNIDGLKLKVNFPGTWKVYYPGDANGIDHALVIKQGEEFTVRKFNIHEMIAFKQQM